MKFYTFDWNEFKGSLQIDPVKNSGIAFNAIDQRSLSFVEFTTQYFVYNFLLKSFGVE